jgi:3,2-trans-enoyl-CoA isomerase
VVEWNEFQKSVLVDTNVFIIVLPYQYKPDEIRLKNFWHSFQQVYLDLYGSRLATVAAIHGHAPAAGCMLALSCDYRIMASADDSGKSPSIGLNETKLGIVAPPWLGQQMIDTVGQRHAELGLSLGLLYDPNEALAIGLVDELVPKDKVLEAAQVEAKKWGNIPAKARFASKMLARKARLDHLEATRKEDTDFFCSFVTNTGVQKTLESYLQSLAKKKSK